MPDEIIRATPGQFSESRLICKIQGTAMCHINGQCRECPFALAHLNPDKTLHFFMGKGVE